MKEKRKILAKVVSGDREVNVLGDKNWMKPGGKVSFAYIDSERFLSVETMERGSDCTVTQVAFTPSERRNHVADYGYAMINLESSLLQSVGAFREPERKVLQKHLNAAIGLFV